MYNKENFEEGEGMHMGMEGHMMDMCGCTSMTAESKKAFKIALLKKKEKILQAKLEFVREMREMMEKMPVDKKESEEE